MHWLQMIQKTQQKPKQIGCKLGICHSSGFFFLTKPNAAIKGKTFYGKKYEEKITFRVFFVHQYIFIQQFYMLNNIHTHLPYIIVMSLNTLYAPFFLYKHNDYKHIEAGIS